MIESFYLMPLVASSSVNDQCIDRGNGLCADIKKLDFIPAQCLACVGASFTSYTLVGIALLLDMQLVYQVRASF